VFNGREEQRNAQQGPHDIEKKSNIENKEGTKGHKQKTNAKSR